MCYTSMAPNKIYRVIFIGELVSEISVTIEQEVKAQKMCLIENDDHCAMRYMVYSRGIDFTTKNLQNIFRGENTSYWRKNIVGFDALSSKLLR